MRLFNIRSPNLKQATLGSSAVLLCYSVCNLGHLNATWGNANRSTTALPIACSWLSCHITIHGCNSKVWRQAQLLPMWIAHLFPMLQTSLSQFNGALSIYFCLPYTSCSGRLVSYMLLLLFLLSVRTGKFGRMFASLELTLNYILNPSSNCEPALCLPDVCLCGQVWWSVCPTELGLTPVS